jgi:hypothetical protein
LENKDTKEFDLANFGVISDAASALKAATFHNYTIKAVVSLSGRPDLAVQE